MQFSFVSLEESLCWYCLRKMAESKRTPLAHEVIAAPDVDEALTPVIFLHAMLCSKEVWEDIPKKVADATKRRVYIYDARHHGENKHEEDKHYEKFSFDLNVDDLFQFMDDIKVDKAILVGHSMGGVTAIRATLKKPIKIEKLISVEMYFKELSDELIKRIILFVKNWKDAVAALPQTTEMKDVTIKSVEELYKSLPENMQEPPEKDAYLKAKFLYKKIDGKYAVKFNAEAIDKFLQKYKELEGETFKKLRESYATQKCDIPAYFIYAANSHYKIKSEKDDIKKYFKNVEFVEINGASHFIFVEEPDKFTEELIKCLQK